MSSTTSTADIKTRLESLVEWTKSEVEDMQPVPSTNNNTRSDRVLAIEKESSDEVKISNVPSEEDAGMEEDLVRLCATMAGGVYQTTQKVEFEKLLTDNPALQSAFPDLSLRFYQTGVTIGRMNSNNRTSVNAPTLAGVITGDTLILAFRGTVTIADMMADLKMDSVQPWKREYEGLEVQRAYYILMKDSYFGKKHSHRKDIINYVNGNYSKVPGKTAKDGTPIKRIIVSGHSLGGGLAQVTHLCLTTKGGAFDDMVDAIEHKQVQVKTLAFAAPMTTVLVNPSKKTLTYLADHISPNMRNVCFRTDPVPRSYANLTFILDLLDDIKHAYVAAKTADDIKMLQTLTSFLKGGLLPWVVEYLEGKIESSIEQASKYCHVGKIIHYDTGNSTPAVYTDWDISMSARALSCSSDQIGFRGLEYQRSEDDPIAKALKCHSFLVAEKGLGYD